MAELLIHFLCFTAFSTCNYLYCMWLFMHIYAMVWGEARNLLMHARQTTACDEWKTIPQHRTPYEVSAHRSHFCIQRNQFEISGCKFNKDRKHSIKVFRVARSLVWYFECSSGSESSSSEFWALLSPETGCVVVQFHQPFGFVLCIKSGKPYMPFWSGNECELDFGVR